MVEWYKDFQPADFQKQDYFYFCLTIKVSVTVVSYTEEALDDFKNKQKSIWSNSFWFAKVCIFWKFIEYTIHSAEAQGFFLIKGACEIFDPVLLLLKFMYLFKKSMASLTVKFYNSFQN